MSKSISYDPDRPSVQHACGVSEAERCRLSCALKPAEDTEHPISSLANTRTQDCNISIGFSDPELSGS